MPCLSQTPISWGRHANSRVTRTKIKSAKRTRDWRLGKQPLATLVLGCAPRSGYAAYAIRLYCRLLAGIRPF